MENELEKVQTGMEELKDAMNQKFANLESSVESVPGHVREAINENFTVENVKPITSTVSQLNTLIEEAFQKM
jgi:hypothetical protein